MIRFTLIIICILAFSFNTKAQENIENVAKQSALTHQYLFASNSGITDKNNPKYVYTFINNQKYINAFVKVKNQSVQSELNDLGILVGTKAGNIWTVKIPIKNVEKLALLKSGIDILQLDQPIYSTLDKARAKSKVDLVHEGTNLPQAFTGKNVVVGILDVGFDYTHPTFYDENGSNYRIKRIWEQKSTGTPPPTYSYGHEITDALAMISQQSDNSAQSHGSHVAGIAAGSGYGGDDDRYKGVAFESDLVFVGITPAQDQWTNTGMTDIVDGINYIFEYAESQGKAAVANLSWGCSIGPHDGSSLFSQAVDNLTGEGKIFTISAGNNGENNIHLNKEFSSSDTLLKSVVQFSANLTEQKTWIDIWGDSGESFCVQLETYNGLTPISTTDFLCLDNLTIDTFLIGSDNDTFYLNLTAISTDINGKPHAFLDIHSKTNDNIVLSVKSANGEVNVWMGYVLESTGYYGQFGRNGLSGASNGNSRMTIGEMACTKSAITVGAYASKNTFTNIFGLEVSYSSYVATDRLCPFSSKGPTSDGRIKPNITAPGMTLASAVNSFDAKNKPGGSSYDNVVYKYTDTSSSHDYYYGEASGTSMSSPMVAGIVALILEARPLSTPDDIMILLENTAIKDNFTSSNPDPDKWGPGKVDAHAIMQSFFPVSVAENFVPIKTAYPNPTYDILNIDFEGPKTITVTKMMGAECLRQKTNNTSISLLNLDSGIYIVSVYSQDNKLLTKQKVVKI